VPVLVRGLLSNHNAERLACGMSHVAVVATQRSKANSSNGSTPVTRLLTWGKNAAGQLGIGAGREDHFMPQVRGWLLLLLLPEPGCCCQLLLQDCKLETPAGYPPVTLRQRCCGSS